MSNADDARKKKSSSKSKRAGLSLPISRITKRMRDSRVGKRCSGDASVIMTGAAEAVLLAILGSAMEEMGSSKKPKKRIEVPNIISAIRFHPDLNRAFSDFIVATDTALTRPGDSVLSKHDINRKTQKMENAA